MFLTNFSTEKNSRLSPQAGIIFFNKMLVTQQINLTIITASIIPYKKKSHQYQFKRKIIDSFCASSRYIKKRYIHHNFDRENKPLDHRLGTLEWENAQLISF